MNLSLFTKGLLLVAVPIVFQIGFVGAFVYLKNEADKETAQAHQARHVAECFNKTTRDLYALYILFDRVHSGNKLKAVKTMLGLYPTEFKPVLANLKQEHAELDRLTADSASLNSTVKRSAKSISTISDILDETYNRLISGNVDDVLLYGSQQADALKIIFDRLVSQEFLVAAEHESTFEQKKIESQHKIRDWMVTLMICACFTNVAVCIVQAYFLFSNIISRLAILSDNARRIAAFEKLNPPIYGDDEIAEVDQGVHRMARSLEESARSKQEIVNMLTHDLRSPLAAIKGSLEILLLGRMGQLSPQNVQLVEMADRNSERMMGLIRDLLDVEKIKAGMMTIEPDKVSLQDLLDDVALSVRGWVTAHGINITVDCEDIYIYADEEKISRVVHNLVSNAIKFSPQGSTIRLSAEVASNGMAQIAVSDQGMGMPEEAQAKIFERFQQVEGEKYKGKEGSSGLGLAICRAIVELHKGKIWVRSKVDQGTTFFFTVPQARADKGAN